MANILTKLCFGRAIGVYYCGERVSITDLGITVKGLTTLNQESFEMAGKSLTNILQEYIKNHGGKNASVCLGLKPEQMFFITSRTEYQQDGQVRDKLLDQAGFHSAEDRSTVVADYFRINKTKSSSGPLCSIGVCKKQLAAELHSALNAAGFTDYLLKPTPWSMAVFASAKLPKKCKSWRVFVQIFLNETGGVAVLMLEKHPICWKRFSSTSESVEKMISAIRSIFMQSIVTLSHPMVDGIILQGTNAQQFSGKLYDNLGIEVVVVEGAGFTDSYCGHSLAMSAMAKDVTQFDMFHELRTKPSIIKIFPWKIAAAIVLMICSMGFMMWQRAMEIAEACNSIKKQNLAYNWATSKATPAIADERKKLLSETEAMVKFVSTRIIWTDYLNDLPTRLPPNVSLTNLGAMCEYQEGGKKEVGDRKKDTKALSMRGFTLFDKGQAATKEIEAFLESLRKVELLQRDLPNVQMAEVKWRREGKSEKAIFTILAAPKAAKSSEGDAKDAKGGKASEG